MCCLKGHVSFAGFTTPNEHPGFLKKFVKSPSLLRKIRAYNNALVLTSMGTICHRISSLLSEYAVEPSFAQVYVYDGDMEHQLVRRMSIMDGLGRTTFKAIQMMLLANNPYFGDAQDPGTDLRTHNRSTANEVAAITVDIFATKERHDIVKFKGEAGYNASQI
ncbi:Helitron helicase [Phytophthora megakarya]|uniref:Helitron helicase n=1 Tax=Phytophthora megakarya TaxID=4795 RepID=A0A225V432_9STRA|nr:Helitron helicase [Phytophthora megakarya]